MSKIFQALQKERGDIQESVIQAIDGGSLSIPMFEIQAPSAILRGPAGETSPVSAAPSSFGYAAEPVADDSNLFSAIQVQSLKISASTPLLPFDTKSIRASEEYRMIRTKIFQHPLQPRMMVISSAGPADGKSITAVNLAGALSLKTEGKVLLIDGDIRRSSIATLLGVSETPGLTDLLAAKCALEDAIIHTEQLPNLYILPGGASQSNPAELLDSAAWVSLSARLRKQFRYIIVDSPPMQAVADYSLIQAVCDGVIVVVRPDHTARSVCEKALKSVPAEKMIGIILNCVEDWFLTKRDNYYGYRY